MFIQKSINSLIFHGKVMLRTFSVDNFVEKFLFSSKNAAKIEQTEYVAIF
jgi:hypothetical protein